MGITIKDVAHMANTSIATVSRYLNNKKVKEENRREIEEAIKELGYEINIVAKNLKMNKTMSIGIVVPNLAHNYDINIVKGIQNVISRNSYYSLIMDTDNDIKKEKEAVNFLYNKRVDGIIVDPINQDTKIYSEFINNKIPIVFIDQKINDIQAPAVVADNIDAVYRAAEHLIKMGHKKISIIIGSRELFTANERITGYLRVLHDYNIDVIQDYVKNGEYDLKSGYDKMMELLSMNDKPTAVIVTNYDMTKGALQAINERNISIPNDISFIGYDILELTQIYKPRLSMVIQPMIEMGEKAAELLLNMMKNQDNYKDMIFRLKTQFIIDNSVKKIRS